MHVILSLFELFYTPSLDVPESNSFGSFPQGLSIRTRYGILLSILLTVGSLLNILLVTANSFCSRIRLGFDEDELASVIQKSLVNASTDFEKQDEGKKKARITKEEDAY